MVQSFAETDSGRRCVMYGRRYKFVPAQLEEATVAKSVPGRPFEHPNCVLVGHPRPQDLTALVPVDQEDEGCADQFEKGITPLFVIAQIPTGDEIEPFVTAEAL